MFPKALIMKELQKQKSFLYILFFFGLGWLLMRTITTIQEWQHSSAQEGPLHITGINEIFAGSNYALFISFLLVILGAVMVGRERNNRLQDFTASLPFKRKSIFTVKWSIGALFIALFYSVSYGASLLIIALSDFQALLSGLSVYHTYVFPLIVFISFFTFSLFIGTIAGEMVSQIALTFIFLIFPFGFTMLINLSVDIHAGVHLPVEWLEWIQKGTLFFYFDQQFFHDTEPGIAFPLMLSASSFLLGLFLFEKGPNEFNGEFLVFKRLEPLFKAGIVGCFALLGGIIASTFVPAHLGDEMMIVFYWCGAVFAGFFAWLLSSKVMDFKIKGSMRAS
ncbi:ABC transporter permease subunit [Salsuginibacillus kocurii]|uniref:ABC transporter permease subunit n=1 Tax=Salsuginibacillus kocurii TaxID=427078 RepID=UPI00035DE2AD|nr:ABC transporter permease subunit [Salsuginibacillus kocurii]